MKDHRLSGTTSPLLKWLLPLPTPQNFKELGFPPLYIPGTKPQKFTTSSSQRKQHHPTCPPHWRAVCELRLPRLWLCSSCRSEWPRPLTCPAGFSLGHHPWARQGLCASMAAEEWKMQEGNSVLPPAGQSWNAQLRRLTRFPPNVSRASASFVASQKA